MVHEKDLFVLLQNIIHKEMILPKTPNNHLRDLDYLILTMLIDYRIKESKEIEADNEIHDSNLNLLHNQLDNAIKHNQIEFDKIIQLLKG